MRLSLIAVATFTCAALSGPARACAVAEGLSLRSVLSAELVVIGEITELHQPDGQTVPPHHAASLQNYAGFSLKVSEEIVGEAPADLRVTWGAGPSPIYTPMPQGPILIALNRGNRRLFLRTGWTVIQAPCAPPFIVDAGGKEAEEARQVLASASR